MKAAKIFSAVLTFFLAVNAAFAAQMRVIWLHSHALAKNVLHDPDTRVVPIFYPDQATNGARLPVVYYLPGFGNTSANFANANSNAWLKFTQKIADDVSPVVLAIGDGKTRWGGSQYLNSTAQGNYESFICDEVVTAVEKNFPAPTSGIRRIVAGHSSGGFGALRLGSSRPKLFDAVIALSPDSDFLTSHFALVKIQSVAKLPLAEVKKIQREEIPLPKDDDIAYAIGLSAAYAPSGWPHRGEFEWLYDAKGNFRDDVWKRWLGNDPLTVVRKRADAFSPAQKIYLEGAAQDQFSANIGARKIFELLKTRSSPCTFYEPPGKHSDHVRERFQRGLEWVFDRPLTDVK